MKRLLIAVACSLFWISPAHAQTCMGALTFSAAPMRLGVGGAFSSNTHGVSGGIGKGTDQMFYSVGGVFQGISGIDSAKGVFGSVGAERTLDADKKYFVCPVGNVFLLFGPHPAPDTNIRTFIVNGGGVFGFVAATSGTTKIVPTAGLSVSYTRSTWSGGGYDFSQHDSYFAAQFGAGFILNDKMSITPTIIVPFSSDIGETIFSVVFTTRIGQK